LDLRIVRFARQFGGGEPKRQAEPQCADQTPVDGRADEHGTRKIVELIPLASARQADSCILIGSLTKNKVGFSIVCRTIKTDVSGKPLRCG
jgi:hypothetical protein